MPRQIATDWTSEAAIKRAAAAVRAPVTVENPAPYQRRIAEMEAQRAELVAELRTALASQIDRVELDLVTERCVIHYRLTTGVNLASPRGFEPRLPP